jgi:hypothetical protein
MRPMANKGTLHYASPTTGTPVRKPRPRTSGGFALAASACAGASLVLIVILNEGGIERLDFWFRLRPVAVALAIPVLSLATIPLTAGAFAASSRRAAIFAFVLCLFSLIGTVSLAFYVFNHAAFGALPILDFKGVCRIIAV